MKFDLQQTIVAVGSGVAPGRRAIVRLSGRQTRDILERLIGQDVQADEATTLQGAAELGWGARRIELTILYWPNERSYTGEPCAELHVLGSLPIVESLVEQLISLGAAPAERGEFTLRSFLAGKLDLAQAEAVLGVIESETTDDLTAALQQLGGNLSKPVRRLRDSLIELTAHLEAGLDFVEEDIEFISATQLTEGLQRIAEELSSIAQQLRSRGARARDAAIVLVGLPNSGKSSLLNALVGAERAIVSAKAGTTRDAVTSRIVLDGLSVEITDTAGVEELHEQSPRGLAQDVLRERLQRADVALLCVDLHQPPQRQWFVAQHAQLQSVVPSVLLVGTKLDLATASDSDSDTDSVSTSACTSAGEAISASAATRGGGWPQSAAQKLVNLPLQPDVAVSVRDPQSIDRLQGRIAQALQEARGQLHSHAMHATATRCRGALELALVAIERAQALVVQSAGEELVASELRVAIDDLSSIIGEVHNEDILGEIFGRFCIGK